MKIYFRYLLLEMLKPLGFCLLAFLALLIVVDLFGSLEEFNEHKASFDVILKYYIAMIPLLIQNMLPVSVLFATLYTLLNLSRRSELTALQAGGMGPVTLFAPFIVVATVCAIFLFVVMGWPATQSEATREQLMEELRTGGKQSDVARNVVYVDPLYHHVWHIKVLNEKNGQAKDIDVLLRDHHKNDWIKYVANEAEFKDGVWNLRNGRKFMFEEGNDVPKQQAFETLQAKELTTPAITLAYVQAEPDELTLDELFSFQMEADYLAPAKMAQYQTQFWYIIAYPSSIFVLLLFALTMGITTDRRTGAAAGVFNAIFLLLAFVFVMEFFLALGRGNRIWPFVAAWAGPVLFAGLALVMMGRKYGWFWQLERVTREWLERKYPQLVKKKGEKLPQDQLNLRLKSLQLLLDRVTKKNPKYQESEADAKKESDAEDKDEVKAEDTPPELPEKKSKQDDEEKEAPEEKSGDKDTKAKDDAPPPLPERQGPEEEGPPALPKKSAKKDSDKKDKPSSDSPPSLPGLSPDELDVDDGEEDAPPPLPQKFSEVKSGEDPPPLPSKKD